MAFIFNCAFGCILIWLVLSTEIKAKASIERCKIDSDIANEMKSMELLNEYPILRHEYTHSLGNSGKSSKIRTSFNLPSSQVRSSFGEPITYNVGYEQFWKIGAAWSGTGVHKDYSSNYPVLTYSEYASLDEFIKNYPTVTIETYGHAYSDETIGDVGSGKFGTRTFDTRNFKNKNYLEKIIVTAHQNAFWWHTSVQIGFGFKYEDDVFYLRPFIDGWIYSGGAVWRYLNFGLGVTTITFNPKNHIEVLVPFNHK